MAASKDSFGLIPVRSLATHELVLEQIRTAINLGRFQPGDRLPTERDLAEMFEVSRTTVREAVAVLEGESVIEVRRGRTGGLIVREASLTRKEYVQRLRQSRAELLGIFDLRVAVESAAAGLAAQRRTAKDLARLRRLLRAMGAIETSARESEEAGGPSSFSRFRGIDSQFHLAIAEAARSPRLAETIVAARGAMFHPIGAVFVKIEPSAHELHEAVVDAIDDRDHDRAAALMGAHIEATRATVEAWL